jgi:phosphatidylglycerol:prolipoprotein diacylglycerol transferase
MRYTIVNFLNQITGTAIFEFIIPTSSVINFIAFCLISIFFIRRCKQSNLDTRTSFYCVLLGGPFAFIGAKLFYVLLHLKSYILKPSHVFSQGGTVSWGAYIGITLGIIILLKHMKQLVFPFLDCLGSCLALGPFIGRWGCFLNGCDYGKITNLPWAVQYPKGSIPFSAHVHDGIIGFESQLSAPVHPNQIYLSLSTLFIFIFMTWFWKRMQQFKGLTFCVYIGVYGILRFALEQFRDEPATNLIPAFNFSQVISLITVTFSILLLLYLYKSKKITNIKNN